MDNDNDLDVYITNRPDSFYLPLIANGPAKKIFAVINAAINFTGMKMGNSEKSERRRASPTTLVMHSVLLLQI